MQLRSTGLGLARIASTLAIASLLLAFPARAQDEDEDEEEEQEFQVQPGFYLLAQFTNNIGTFSSPEATVQTSSGRYSTGAAGAFGYRIDEHLAAELSGDWISGWQVHAQGESTNLVGGSYGVNVKGYLKSGRIQPYGVLGLGATFMQVRNTQIPKLHTAQWDMSVRVGFGADWYLTRNLGLNISPTVVIPVGISDEVGDLMYVSIAIGGFLRFGE